RAHGERIWPKLQVATGAVRPERRVDAVGRHDYSFGRDAVALDEVALRPLRDGQDPRGAPSRSRHHTAEDPAVATAHQNGILALEREVVDRHDDRTGGAERPRILGVHERGAEAIQDPGQSPRHPQLLRARREGDRLDALWDELGVPGHRPDPEPGRRGGAGERPEEVAHVALVAGPLAAEDVGVDYDEVHASSRQSASTRSAERSQVKAAARVRPAATSSSRRRTASPIPAAIAAGSRGSTSTAAPAATSSVAPPRLVTTGVPHAIASRIGSPKPSYRDG